MKPSTSSRPENSPDVSFESTSEGLRPTLILKLACGCTMTESVNTQRTQTSLQLWRSSTCKRLSHFTVEESGWPQIVDAVKATILHCDVSSEKCAGRGVT